MPEPTSLGTEQFLRTEVPMKPDMTEHTNGLPGLSLVKRSTTTTEVSNCTGTSPGNKDAIGCTPPIVRMSTPTIIGIATVGGPLVILLFLGSVTWAIDKYIRLRKQNTTVEEGGVDSQANDETSAAAGSEANVQRLNELVNAYEMH